MPAYGNTLCEGHNRKEVQQWIGNNVCPTDWGWQYRDESLVPLTTDRPDAPTRVLRIVRLQDRLSEDMRMPDVQLLQWTNVRQHSCANAVIGLYREYAIAIQDEVGDSNGGNV